MKQYFGALTCARCDKPYDIEKVQNLCECGGPLLARMEISSGVTPDEFIDSSDDTLWRYNRALPLMNNENRVSLGERMTPLVHAEKMGAKLGLNRLLLKDEGVNPTGSFKARGMSVALSRAKELGIEKVALPSAGNAGCAAAAYAEAAGMDCAVFIPADTPEAFITGCEEHGAEVELVDGTIADAGKRMAERLDADWFNLSTLKEPYRVEGKKTMGYEIAEQMGWRLPDVIVYPTGGGTGLIGMWKAFGEMEALGWLTGKRPKMVAVQCEGCAPMVKAFGEGKTSAEHWENAETSALGLRVPSAVGDSLILSALYESGGSAIAVSDKEAIRYALAAEELEGISSAPEAGAALAAAGKLLESGYIGEDDEVLVFITGNGEKYSEILYGASD